MIQFNAIQLHDLVYLNNGDDIDEWFLVTGVSQKVGFFTATQLGYDIRPVMVPSDRMGIVQKHYSAIAVPGAIETLQQIAAGEIAVDVEPCDEKKNILVLRPERNEFGYEVVQLARAALRAVRGEGPE